MVNFYDGLHYAEKFTDVNDHGQDAFYFLVSSFKIFGKPQLVISASLPSAGEIINILVLSVPQFFQSLLANHTRFRTQNPDHTVQAFRLPLWVAGVDINKTQKVVQTWTFYYSPKFYGSLYSSKCI